MFLSISCVQITASHDKSIRLWELSDEFINLQEEEEKEREKDYEERLLDAEDIVKFTLEKRIKTFFEQVPGEALEKEADFAPIKTIESVKSVGDSICKMSNKNLLLDGTDIGMHRYSAG